MTTQTSRETRRIDRLPPHSDEAEQGVLGCILLSPNETLGRCVQRLRVGSGAFYDLRHQTIYSALLSMWDQRQAIDMITLTQKLKDEGTLEQVGGYAYVGSLADVVPSAANVGFYLDILEQKYLLRRIVQVCTQAVGEVYDYEGDPAGRLDELEREVMGIRREVGAEIGEVDKREAIKQLIAEYEAAMGGVKLTGLPTGFTDFDRMTGGLKPQQLVVVAGRPGKGKTSFALNIGERVAFDHGNAVGLLSLEMSGKELIHRLITSRANVNSADLVNGKVSETGIMRLTTAAASTVSAPIYICDKGGLTIQQAGAILRRMVQVHGIKLGIVDYLGLLRAGVKTNSRYEEVTYISGGLKALAKELQIPIIALAQLNRDSDREDRAPRVSDLRDSGSIEQDADIIGLLHDGGRVPCDDDYGQYELRVAKQRNGPVGTIDLVFRREFTRFESAAVVADVE